MNTRYHQGLIDPYKPGLDINNIAIAMATQIKLLVSQVRPHLFFHPAWPFGGGGGGGVVVLYFSGKGRQNQFATKYCLLRNSLFYIT